MANPRSSIEMIGNDATFTCDALGGPGNQFQWLKSDVVLVDVSVA